MNNFGPCAKDCPNRKAGCDASCEAWNAVKGERLKSYGRRAEIIDISQIPMAGRETAGGRQEQKEGGGSICDKSSRCLRGIAGSLQGGRWIIRRHTTEFSWITILRGRFAPM